MVLISKLYGRTPPMNIPGRFIHQKASQRSLSFAPGSYCSLPQSPIRTLTEKAIFRIPPITNIGRISPKIENIEDPNIQGVFILEL